MTTTQTTTTTATPTPTLDANLTPGARRLVLETLEFVPVALLEYLTMADVYRVLIDDVINGVMENTFVHGDDEDAALLELRRLRRDHSGQVANRTG